MTKAGQAAKQEELRRQREVTALRTKVQKLNGEHDYIKGQHAEAKNKVRQAQGDVGPGDVHRDLFEMDKSGYARALGDVATKPEQ